MAFGVKSVTSSRNHLVDFNSKSIDWFLYNGNIGRKWV